MKFVTMKHTTFEEVKPLTVFFGVTKRGGKVHYDPYFKLHDDRAVWLKDEYPIRMREDAEVAIVVMNPEYKKVLRDMVKELD